MSIVFCYIILVFWILFIIYVNFFRMLLNKYHSCICDDKNIRLLHSCSEFRETDTAFRNAIGRANKYLHWKDMLYFINQHKEKYDWGGISSFDTPNGIDKFKMSF